MAEAFARAALAGNPSDGYGGAVVAITVPAFRATVWVVDAAGPEASHAGVADPEVPLLTATAARFARDFGTPRRRLAMTTTIPRSVGLGGSSAIVVAALRALCEREGIALGPARMATLALSIEVDDLDIAAGLQDRLVQCHEGLLFMDFAGDEPLTDQLPQIALPPTLIAWQEDSAAPSQIAHSSLRASYERGDSTVLEDLAKLGNVARRTREAVQAGDIAELRRTVNETFEIRRRLMPLDPRHVAMIEAARDAGAAANYTGSGGAIAALCNDPRHLGEVARALRGVGARTVELGRSAQ